ncbi:MAG TPA: radical SAM protein [Clostridiales bacterium]|nr:radical SAM protein [Clostridiales bacterium]
MNSATLTKYLNEGTRNIVKKILKGSIFNFKELSFLLKIKKSFKKSSRIREESENKNIHIPSFLISSITQNCNLFCKGCYARANKICDNSGTKAMLSANEWEEIFKEANKIGISFNLLAGGEPLLRKDVLIAAANVKEMVFPVFTNGTLLDDEYIKFFEKNRNLIPIVSLEGNEATTDDRRGNGTYQKLISSLVKMKKKKLIYGVSITVSKQNLNEVSDINFIKNIKTLGCKVVLFIEYVPVDRSTEQLAFDDNDRIILEEKQDKLRLAFKNILFLSFPGDEKYMGGCLAAGRGFFHINSDGSAEACPFSPYSDCNVKHGSLMTALRSPLFKKIIEINLTEEEHKGGCSLFEKEDIIKELISQ